METERITIELSRLEKFNLCMAITESIIKHKNKLEKINEKISKGEKFYYEIGAGKEDINRVKKREFETIESLNSVYKKLNCP